MTIFGAKSRAMRGCASKLAYRHRIGPRRLHCFYRNLRRIRNFPTGRCRHRPLQSYAQVHSDSPRIFDDPIPLTAGRTESSAPTCTPEILRKNRAQRTFIVSQGADMKEFQYTIQDPMGFHARPAGALVRAAKAYATKLRSPAGKNPRS